MPRVRRERVPRALFHHLLERVADRQITAEQLGLLADWLALEPEVPQGKWFKRFPGMIACGEGEFIKTFLEVGQAAIGTEVK